MGIDTGIYSLVAIARFHQLPAEPEQLAHQFAESGKPFSDTQLLSAAKALTLRAKCISPDLAQIKTDMLPAIAKARDGSYFILARLGESTADDGDLTTRTYLIHDLRDQAPRSVSQADFESLWSGELILVTRRQGLGESLQQKFDISWFIPSLVKYRKLFSEVLIASFFLQLFALVTPLFF